MNYPTETLDPEDDDGTMSLNVKNLEKHVVGHKIVSVQREKQEGDWGQTHITLDNGKTVFLEDGSDCCAYTELKSFLLNPNAVDHIITGVGTTDGYTTWHIYADYGDILQLQVGWSCGNPFYYAYGFGIRVRDPEDEKSDG